MRDYSQYSVTPMKKKPTNQNLVVTPSPASSSVASFPNYRQSNNINSSNTSTATKSQVALLTRAHAQQRQQQLQQQQQLLQQQQQQAAQQKRDAASISTAAMSQSSNDHSPRSNSSDDLQQQQQQQQQQQSSQQQQQQQQQQSQSNHQQHQHQLQQNQRNHLQHPQQQQQRHNNGPHKAAHQQQQHYQQHNNTNSNNTPASRELLLSSLTPEDALSLRRDGPEATIVQLRQALEESKERDTADKSKLEKSDATILELRSSVRQLKRQLEKLDGEARQKHTDLVAAKQQLQVLKQQRQQSSSSNKSTQPQHPDDASSSQQTTQTQEQQHALAKEARVGELEVLLDRAHAQLLTADMVRKELEDTLEAEQYTWELRVQDQERTIVELQQEIGVLAEDLDQCRRQWKEADEEWAHKVAELEQELAQLKQQHQQEQEQKQQQQKGGILQQQNDSNNNNTTALEVKDLQDKLRQLEVERNELQTCLDEALLELEAVDAELGSHTPAEVQQLRQENQKLQEAVQRQRALQQQQQLQQGDADFDTLEGLQHLYRWLLERSADGEEKKSDVVPQTSPELLDSIHHVLESMPLLNARNTASDSSRAKDALTQKVAELEDQLTLYQGDLQAREESSAELRASLKEAVALIKPLQDAVDKAAQQKADLQQEIEGLRADHDLESNEMQEELRAAQHAFRKKEQECERLQHDIHQLNLELKDARELAQARQAMQGLSPTAAAAAATAAHTRPPSEPPQELSSLSKARADLKARRAQEQTLRSLLQDAQNRFHALNQQNQNVEAVNQQLQGRLKDVEEHRSVEEGYVLDVSPANNVGELEQQISKLKQSLEEKSMELEDLRHQAKQPNQEVTKRMQELEKRLATTEDELKRKQQSEKVLNKSLKEALGLLKPLKSHLEEAEEENKELSKEVRSLRRKVTAMEISGMGTVVASPNSVGSKSPQGVNTPINKANDDQIRRQKELEETVRHLEQENSQLHDALDEMSRMNNSNMSGGGPLSPHGDGNPNTPNTAISSKVEARLNQEIVELKSRYEVTQSRLEDAYVENHTLVEALKEKEESEKDAVEGVRILREKLRKTELDLENAKFIATSALVKIEQAKNLEFNVSHNSEFETEAHTVHSLEEKAIELDLLAGAGIRLSPSAASQSPSHGPQGNQFHQVHRQQQQGFTSGGHQHMQNGTSPVNNWAGKRSRLADF